MSTEIDLIRLTRTACYGTCPVYSAEIHRSGLLHYVGECWVPRWGEARVQLPKGSFAQLAALVERHGFWALSEHYSPHHMVTDMPSRIITVRAGRREHSVSDYGLVGPAALTRIEKAIEGRVRRLVRGGRAASDFLPAS